MQPHPPPTPPPSPTPPCPPPPQPTPPSPLAGNRGAGGSRGHRPGQCALPRLQTMNEDLSKHALTQGMNSLHPGLPSTPNLHIDIKPKMLPIRLFCPCTQHASPSFCLNVMIDSLMADPRPPADLSIVSWVITLDTLSRGAGTSTSAQTRQSTQVRR